MHRIGRCRRLYSFIVLAFITMEQIKNSVVSRFASPLLPFTPLSNNERKSKNAGGGGRTRKEAIVEVKAKELCGEGEGRGTRSLYVAHKQRQRHSRQILFSEVNELLLPPFPTSDENK